MLSSMWALVTWCEAHMGGRICLLFDSSYFHSFLYISSSICSITPLANR